MKYLKYFLLIWMITITCTSPLHFKNSQQAFDSGDYKLAQREIDLALKKSPNDSLLLQLKDRITLRQLELKFQKMSRFDLERRSQNLITRKQIINKCNLPDTLQSSLYMTYEKDSIDFRRDKKVSDSLFAILKGYKNNNDLSVRLKTLLQLKPYKPYSEKAKHEFAEFRKNFTDLINQMEADYNQHDFSALETRIFLVDNLYPDNGITNRFKPELVHFNIEKGAVFLKNNKPATALYYLQTAQRLCHECIPSNQTDSVYQKLIKKYDEQIYVAFSGELDSINTDAFSKELILNLKKTYLNNFRLVDSVRNATVVILISLDEYIQSIKRLTPQKKKSKYISAINRQPNKLYQKVKEHIERLKFTLEALEMREVKGDDYSWRVKSLNTALKEQYEILRTMNAYDVRVRYKPYYFTSIPYDVFQFVQFSYKIIDLQSKSILWAGTDTTVYRNRFFEMNGVHPKDDSYSQIATSFDKQRVMKKLSDRYKKFQSKIVQNIKDAVAHLYKHRGNIYYNLKEPSEAVESYFLSEFLKGNKTEDNPYLTLDRVLPFNLDKNLNRIEPSSTLSYKLSLITMPKLKLKTK